MSNAFIVFQSIVSKLSRNSEQARLLHNARQTTKTDRLKNKRRGVKGNQGNGLIMRVANNIAVQLCQLWRKVNFLMNNTSIFVQ